MVREPRRTVRAQPADVHRRALAGRDEDVDALARHGAGPSGLDLGRPDPVPAPAHDVLGPVERAEAAVRVERPHLARAPLAAVVAAASFRRPGTTMGPALRGAAFGTGGPEAPTATMALSIAVMRSASRALGAIGARRAARSGGVPRA